MNKVTTLVSYEFFPILL